MRVALSMVFGSACLVALPLSAAKAQYCYSPLEWPFCIAGAAVNTAGAIATAPFRPYYYYGPSYSYYGSGYYYGPRYYRTRYYYPRRHYYRRHHHWH